MKGQTINIVGKGASLAYLTDDDLHGTATIGLNDAAEYVFRVSKKKTKLFGLQVDNVKLLNSRNNFADYMMLVSPWSYFQYEDNKALMLLRKMCGSVSYAVEVAKHFGCSKINFVACDFHAMGSTKYARLGFLSVRAALRLKNQSKELQRCLKNQEYYFTTPKDVGANVKSIQEFVATFVQ